MNVFVKPEVQNDACISYALARKGRMKSNYKLKISPRTHCAGLFNSKLFFVKNNFNKIISFKRLIDGDLPLARDN